MRSYVFLSIAILFLLMQGCASNLQKEMAVDRFLPEDSFDSAIEELRSNEKAFGKNSRLLYLMNMGALLHYAGCFEESNRYLQEAYDLADELYTKSISRMVASVVSPNVAPYYGEDYERVMISTFMALNYFRLGALEDALVEARKINKDLELLTDKYEGKDKYKDDAFSHYLAGLIQEAGGETNDAFISYVQAYNAYRGYEKMFGVGVPDELKRDILRLALKLGFKDKYDYFVKEFGEEYTPQDSDSKNDGEIVVVAYTGLAPLKREISISHTGVDSEGKTHTFQIQLPELVERPSAISAVRVKYREAVGQNVLEVDRDEYSKTNDVQVGRTYRDEGGGFRAEIKRDGSSGYTYAFLAQDIVRISAKNMKDKQPWLIAQAWAAALAKYAASEKLKKKTKGENFLGNVVKSVFIDSALEEVTRADIRCWRTIPARIHLARLRIPSGRYDLCVEFLDNSGNTLSRRCSYGVEVVKGTKTLNFFYEFH